MFYWLMKYVVIGPILKAIFRPWIVGRRNVPAEGAAILASNHLSFIDSVFLPLMIDRPMSFLAKSDYFTGKGLKGWATRMFMKGDRVRSRSTAPAARPPRHRSTPACRCSGAATCSASTPRAPAAPTAGSTAAAPASRAWRSRRTCRWCPVVMVDTDTMMPIGTADAARRAGRAWCIGEPLDFSRFAGMEGDRYILRSVTDEIMVALQRLGEQEYDDVYASTVKDRLPASPAA